MALAIGNNAMKGAYLGTNQVRRAYKGGTLVYQGFGPAEEQEFIQQEATGGPAELSKIYGKSIVNNQQIVDADRSGTASHTGSGTYMIKSLSTNQYDFYQHKVFIRGFFKLAATPTGAFVQVDNTTFVLPSFVVDTDTPFSFIGLINTNAWHEFRFYFTGLTPSGGEVLTWHDIELIDLTLRFGAGNEPTSVDEALRLLGGDAFNPTYDPGSLQSNKTAELRAYDGGTMRGSLSLNLSTLTGKLNGEGASVVVYPDGMRGVGDIRDEAEGSTGEVRLGKRAYQAGDESDTSVLTDGTNTIYPLATPLTYTLDTPLPTDFTCEQGDILQRVSDNNCPFVGEMRFGL